MGIEDARLLEAWESLYPDAEGAGKISRFGRPQKAESLRNPYIPVPKAPGNFAILESPKG